MLHSYQKVAIFGMLVSIAAEIKGDFDRIQSSDLPSSTTASNKLNDERPSDLTDRGFAVRAPRMSPSLVGGVRARNRSRNTSSSQLAKLAAYVSENIKRGGVHKKKKKNIVGAIFDILVELLWSIVLKLIPDITKADMFVLGMILHAKFLFFVTSALMMSKVALVSVVMMTMRSSNGQPVDKYHVTSYQRHSHPHQHSSPHLHPHPHPHPHHHHHHHHRHHNHNNNHHHHHRLRKFIYKYHEPEEASDYDFLL